MAGAKLNTGDSSPVGNNVDDDELVTSVQVDPSSTSQNIWTALRLLLQAMKTVPIFTYVSFALSLLFLILYLNPFASLFGGSPAPKLSPEEALRKRMLAHYNNPRVRRARTLQKVYD